MDVGGRKKAWGVEGMRGLAVRPIRYKVPPSRTKNTEGAEADLLIRVSHHHHHHAEEAAAACRGRSAAAPIPGPGTAT